MNLLEQQLFDYTNHYGRIQVVENEEIDSPSQIFVTVLHDETSLSDILPVVR
ncbi:hypothetical protein KBC03_03185 [Patescibacteria group bacterium]|nr:hypothetical protein [Patescibacteria group bacterium]